MFGRLVFFLVPGLFSPPTYSPQRPDIKSINKSIRETRKTHIPKRRDPSRWVGPKNNSKRGGRTPISMFFFTPVTHSFSAIDRGYNSIYHQDFQVYIVYIKWRYGRTLCSGILGVGFPLHKRYLQLI